jgi:hypothetical protein
MTDETIGGYSIKYNSTKIESWTKALKCFLTNLQWLIYMATVKDTMEHENAKKQ